MFRKDDEDQEEEEEDVEDEEEEEEEEDASAETEGLDDSTEKQAEETQSLKPEEQKEESAPDAEQKADREITKQPITAGEEKTGDGVKPANGTTDGESKNQSGPNKKLSLFRHLSFSRTKQNNGTDLTPAEGLISREAAVQGEHPPAPPPPPPAAAAGTGDTETIRGEAPQRSLAQGARTPRSGACTVL